MFIEQPLGSKLERAVMAFQNMRFVFVIPQSVKRFEHFRAFFARISPSLMFVSNMHGQISLLTTDDAAIVTNERVTAVDVIHVSYEEAEVIELLVAENTFVIGQSKLLYERFDFSIVVESVFHVQVIDNLV